MIWNPLNRKAYCPNSKKLRQRFIPRFARDQPTPKKGAEKGTENTENSYGTSSCQETCLSQG